jgi:hypothetical protein
MEMAGFLVLSVYGNGKTLGIIRLWKWFIKEKLPLLHPTAKTLRTWWDRFDS